MSSSFFTAATSMYCPCSTPPATAPHSAGPMSSMARGGCEQRPRAARSPQRRTRNVGGLGRFPLLGREVAEQLLLQGQVGLDRLGHALLAREHPGVVQLRGSRRSRPAAWDPARHALRQVHTSAACLMSDQPSTLSVPGRGGSQCCLRGARARRSTATRPAAGPPDASPIRVFLATTTCASGGSARLKVVKSLLCGRPGGQAGRRHRQRA